MFFLHQLYSMTFCTMLVFTVTSTDNFIFTHITSITTLLTLLCHKMFYKALLLLPLLSCSSLAQCEEGWLEMSSSCYLISPAGHPGGGVDWVVARKACADLGGYLAEISSEEEWAELLVALDVLYGEEESDHLYIGGLSTFGRFSLFVSF